MLNQRTLVFALSVLFFCGMAAHSADNSAVAASPENAEVAVGQSGSKGFVVPGSGASGTSTVVPGQAGAFSSNVELARPKYAVGQPVQFTAKANRDFYLYIINVTAEGETIFLYPRAGAKAKRLRAGVAHKVPRDYNIIVDEPGHEHVLLVSSLTPLNTNGAEGIVLPGATGAAQASRIISELDVEIIAAPAMPFTVATTPEDAQVRVMNIGPKYKPGMLLVPGEYDVEVSAAGYKTQRLPILHSKDAQSHAVALQSLTAPAVPAPGEPAELMLSADQRVFKAGEEVAVKYGATQAGWVHLYTYINGKLENVAGREVEAGKFYTMRATATQPHGEQLLVALWQQEEAVGNMTLANLADALAQTSEKADVSSANEASAQKQGQSASQEAKPKESKKPAQKALVLSVEAPLNFKILPLVINP